MRRKKGVSRYGPWGAWLLVGILCGCTHGSSSTKDADDPVSANDAELTDNKAEPVQDAADAKGADKKELSKVMGELEPEKQPEPTLPAPSPAEKPLEAVPLEAVSSTTDFQTGIASVPMGPGLPETGALMVYVVRPQDTLSMVAKRVYGAVGKWKEIAQLSHLQNPNLIFPGDELYYQLRGCCLLSCKNDTCNC